MLPEPLLPRFIEQLNHAEITHVISVPDGYLAPLITQVEQAAHITHIHAAREEEAIGIAGGLSLAGKKVLVMMQNVGFLNSIGCFATLALNYRLPFVMLIAHRGNIYDRNNYDIPKIRFMDGIFRQMNLFTTSYRQFGHEPDLLHLVMRQAETAGEPTFLMLDMPPNGREKPAC